MWAAFSESYTPLKPFERYETEDRARTDASRWVAERTSEAPEFVCPKINSYRQRQ